MSTKGTSYRGWVPQVRAIGGPTWGLGELHKLPCGVWGRAILPYIQIKSELIFGRKILVFGLWNSAVCQCRNKSGTPSQNRDKWASWESCDFARTSLKIGTISEKPGWMVSLHLGSPRQRAIKWLLLLTASWTDLYENENTFSGIILTEGDVLCEVNVSCYTALISRYFLWHCRSRAGCLGCMKNL